MAASRATHWIARRVRTKPGSGSRPGRSYRSSGTAGPERKAPSCIPPIGQAYLRHTLASQVTLPDRRPMPSTADPPTQLLRAIADDPDDGEHWHALADWLWVEGREDEAVAVRVLRPTLRGNLSCASLATTIADVARNAKVLAAIARKVGRQADETPPV